MGRRWWVSYCVVFLTVLALAVAVVIWWYAGPELPPAEEVERMTAELSGYGKDRLTLKTLDVPRQHIPLILNMLGNASREHWPKKWQLMGQIRLFCKDGHQVEIWLHYTFKESGAFSVGTPPKSQYFCASTDSDLESAIRKAHDDLMAQKQKS
jgi:hypothetical protein